MTLEDQFRLYVDAYYGVLEMDEYKTKEYVLDSIKKFIITFLENNPISNFDYQKEASLIENIPLKRKLQDSLIVLNKISGPLDLILLIKEKIRNIENA